MVQNETTRVSAEDKAPGMGLLIGGFLAFGGVATVVWCGTIALSTWWLMERLW